MTAELATTALRQAIARRQPTGTVVVHSDRAGQFRSRAVRAVLKAAGLRGSMGRVASAGDNAPMESFYSLLQQNIFDRRHWATRDQLTYESIHWIEHTPTTAAVANAASGSSPLLSLSLPSPPHLRQHEVSQPDSTELWAGPYSIADEGVHVSYVIVQVEPIRGQGRFARTLLGGSIRVPLFILPGAKPTVASGSLWS